MTTAPCCCPLTLSKASAENCLPSSVPGEDLVVVRAQGNSWDQKELGTLESRFYVGMVITRGRPVFVLPAC